MRNRTYAGPIIERAIEWGIVFGDDSVRRSSFYCLSVDAGTGELVIIYIRDDGRSIVAFNNQSKYWPAALLNTDVVFTVVDDLSNVETL